MVKILNPSVVKIVGSVASVLLRHLKYWKDSSKKDVIYRTNSQLVVDLEGMYSESQIQRAKKKLIDNGLIEVNYGKGYDRTTHYTLTTKANELLLTPVKQKEEPPIVDKQPPKQQNHYPSKHKSVGKVDDNLPETAKKLFNEAGTKREGVVKGVPDELKKLIGIKDKIKEEVNEPNQQAKELPPLPLVIADEEFFGIPVFEKQEEVEEVEDVSDEEYFGVTPEQWIAIDIANGKIQTKPESLSMNELIDVAFNRIPNVDIRENNRRLLESSRYYNEDY